MYCLCGKYYKLVTVQYYVADFVIRVPGLTLLDLQIGLMKVLLEQNLFICLGLTVFH